MRLLRTRLGVVDLDELAEWNARNKAARDEYERDGLAASRRMHLLDAICDHCSANGHARCSGRVGQHRLNVRYCTCEIAAHPNRRV